MDEDLGQEPSQQRATKQGDFQQVQNIEEVTLEDQRDSQVVPLEQAGRPQTLQANYQQEYVQRMMRRGGHQHQVLEAEEDSSSSSSSTGEDEQNGRMEGKEEEEKGPVDYRHRVMKGSFLPAMVMLDMKQIGVEDPIDSTQGTRLLHYACYFGKLKAIKALCEEFSADTLAKDYRGQTPLHVATSSGELGSMLYLTSALEGKEDLYREVKDNALMTPLMNTVAENNVPSFCYLFFNKQCAINHVDIQGNTLMHLAAKSNSINIAKLLKHIQIDSQDLSSSTYKILKSQSLPQQEEQESTSQQVFFDLNRTNLADQSPIFLTVQSRNIEMMKFLMQNRCSITMKETRGDTLKEHIMRFGVSTADTSMLDAYMKYEDKMIITKIFEPLDYGLNKVVPRVKAYFRWNSPRFIHLFMKLAWEELAKRYHNHMFAGLFTLIYLLHWFFYIGTPTHFVLSGVLHLSSLLLIFALVSFDRSDAGSIQKEHISKNLETNVIGQMLYLMNERQLGKIEELSDRFCFDCLVIRTKHAEHCKRCSQCVNYRHKHSILMNKCIGGDNAQAYYLILLSSYLILASYLFLLVTSYQCETSGLIFPLVEGLVLHWKSTKFLSLLHLCVAFLTAKAFDELCWLTTALSRGLTLRQLTSVYDYKQCFDIKTQSQGDDIEASVAGKSYFVHKKVSLVQIAANWVRFLTGRILREAKTRSKRVRVKKQYSDLNTSTSRSMSTRGAE